MDDGIEERVSKNDDDQVLPQDLSIKDDRKKVDLKSNASLENLTVHSSAEQYKFKKCPKIIIQGRTGSGKTE